MRTIRGLILEEFATAEEILFDEDVDPLQVMPVNVSSSSMA